MSNELDQRTGLPALTKRSAEVRDYYVDFSNLLASGDTLTGSPTVTAVTQGLVTGSSDLTLGAKTISGNMVKFRITGGTNREDYAITAQCGTTDTETVETEVLLRVRD